MKSFSFIVWQIKIPFYEIPVLGHSPFSIYKSTVRCYTELSNRIGVSADVNFICKIDRELYRVVEQELLTEEVIITEEQILHIEEGHPGDYGRLSAYISQVLQEPDLHSTWKSSAHCIGVERNLNTGLDSRNYSEAESFQ